MHRRRNHGERRYQRTEWTRRRTDHRPGVRQVSMNTHTYPHTPENENFRRTIRIIHNIITATHHLQNVTHSKGAPAAIARKTQELINLIKAAQPTQETTKLLEENALNWQHTTTHILARHYTKALDAKKLELSHCLPVDLEKAFSIAKNWAYKRLRKRLKSETLEATHNIVQDLRAVGRLDIPPSPPHPLPPGTETRADNDSDQPRGPPLPPPASPPLQAPPLSHSS